MNIPTTDDAFNDEFSERLLESLRELEASYEKLKEQLEPAITQHSHQLVELQDQVLEIRSMISRRWREIILVDDDGIVHRIPKTGFMHITYIPEEPKKGTTRTFPLPTTRFPCLRIFSATFPGVCYDFRAKGQIPVSVIRRYSKNVEDQEKVLNARAFLYELTNRFVDGLGFTLQAQEFSTGGILSIEVNTYQYQH